MMHVNSPPKYCISCENYLDTIQKNYLEIIQYLWLEIMLR